MKKHVLILMGGVSGEHEVSIMSAKGVISAIDVQRYEVIKVGISRKGTWFLLDDKQYEKVLKDGFVSENLPESALVAGLGTWALQRGACHQKAYENLQYLIDHTDVVFPVMHGPNAEDGSIQGLLEQLKVPYVSCGVTASAVAMDKAIAKAIFRQNGIPVVKDVLFYRHEYFSQPEKVLEKVELELGYPVFVKPVNMGSSVGISKAGNRGELKAAILEAVQYDVRILVEQGLDVRELECAVLGYHDFIVTAPGEVLPADEFYSYHDKYFDGKSSTKVPANVSDIVVNQVKKYAEKAFRAIDGSGMARIDFFLDRRDGNLYLNEINTIPGFTSISMYASLIAQEGISYTELIDRLLDLAVKRFEERKEIKVSAE